MIQFIIPSIGRCSLGQTLASLLAQTDPQWSATVLFSDMKSMTGVSLSPYSDDPRIHVMNRSHQCVMEMMETETPHHPDLWIAVLREGYTCSPHVVKVFHQALLQPLASLGTVMVVNREIPVMAFPVWQQQSCPFPDDEIVSSPIYTTGRPIMDVYTPDHELQQPHIITRATRSSYTLMAGIMMLTLLGNIGLNWKSCHAKR